VVSYQRPCQGSCGPGLLDPPTDLCEERIRLEPGKTLTTSVVLGPFGGCTFEFD
jgi:hypothetical protein